MTHRPPKTTPLGRLLELGSLAARAGASTAATYVSSLGRAAPRKEALRTAELVKNARRLVATLGDLKGAAMKVGQMLSLQDAFLPPEVAAVLRTLQKETPSLPLEMVEEQLAAELDDPLQLFTSFEPEAFAAASIGQVHRAVLRDGRRVAVKVQYPGIDRIVEADLGNLRRVLKSVVALVSKVDFEPIWLELRARLREELDYLHEAERMRRMAELHANVPEIVVPRVVEEATTSRILTMEYEEGLSPDEACSAATPQELKDRWGVVLFDFLLRGLLEHHLLHADPNLANFAFRADGRVVVYDFGCIKEVPLRLARGYRDLCRAALDGRTEDLPGLLKRMGMHRLDGRPLEESLVAPWAALVLELLRPSPPYRFGVDDSVATRLFGAATDLVRGRLEVFTTGPLIRPVVASSSVPLIFTPTEVDGCLFVDGGIIDNFPVDPLIGLCNVILGVYVSPLPSPDASELRSSFAVSQRALEIGMFHNSRRNFHKCDLVLCPPALAGQPTFALRQSRSLVEIGHAAALGRMDEIRALVERGRRGGCGKAR